MAEKYIEKVTQKKNADGTKEKVVTKYRVDADFVPEKSTEICNEFIEAYCIANNETDWLCDRYEATVRGKDGFERPYPYVKIKAEFIAKFFPTLASAAKGTNNSRAAFLAKYRKK